MSCSNSRSILRVMAKKDEIAKILADYGVPLVQCSDCVVAGDLPSHGAYQTAETPSCLRPRKTPEDWTARMADLQAIVSSGRKPRTMRMSDAIVANDIDRVGYLLTHKAQVNAIRRPRSIRR